MEIQAKEIMALMEEWAPARLAEDWDHPGLQAGDPRQPVRSVLVTLDMTMDNVSLAARRGMDMIVSHHPFLFRPLKEVDLRTEKGKILELLLRHHICSFAAHTNLDTADGGVNDALAAALELRDCRGLIPVSEEKIFKLAVYVPQDHADRVRATLAEAGAGATGQYSHCSFSVEGIGRFKPGEEAHPFIGQKNQLETVEEVRIETIIPARMAAQAVKAMKKAHPYETAAYDLYPMENGSTWQSMGRIGELPQPMSGRDALAYVKNKLNIPVLRYCGNIEKEIHTVAVLGGAGAEFAQAARNAGAEMYLTGDIKYHEAQDMAAMGLLAADGGHFWTERVIIPWLVRRLTVEARKRDWDVRFEEDPTAQDIFQYL